MPVPLALNPQQAALVASNTAEPTGAPPVVQPASAAATTAATSAPSAAASAVQSPALSAVQSPAAASSYQKLTSYSTVSSPVPNRAVLPEPGTTTVSAVTASLLQTFCSLASFRVYATVLQQQFQQQLLWQLLQQQLLILSWCNALC